MAIEHAWMRVVHKPWGSTDLRPWSEIRHDGSAIGELWFQRPRHERTGPSLAFKLLFTKEPLSIQVHPDDAFRKSIGLGHGKSEARYILSATPGAKIAIGLKRRLTAPQLRASIEDGSISDLVQWHRVLKDDVIFVPAATIHAIGPGLVVAEIQQRSDATFRLFDHGRQRELHVDNAVAAANAGPAECQSVPRRLTDARTLLVASPHFVLERIGLSPQSNWELRAERETWVLVLEGHARAGPRTVFAGEAIFLEADHTSTSSFEADARRQAASRAAIQAETSSASLMALLRDGSDPPFGRICLVGALDGAWHGQATPKPNIGTAPGRNVNLNLASSIMRYSEQSKMVTAAP